MKMCLSFFIFQFLFVNNKLLILLLIISINGDPRIIKKSINIANQNHLANVRDSFIDDFLMKTIMF